MGWGDRLARMQSSIVGDLGPSVWASYFPPESDEAQRLKGVYTSPYMKQAAQDFDSEVAVTSEDPRFGVRLIDVSPVQDAELTIDDEPSKRFRVQRIEDGPVGWVDMVLELISD